MTAAAGVVAGTCRRRYRRPTNTGRVDRQRFVVSIFYFFFFHQIRFFRVKNPFFENFRPILETLQYSRSTNLVRFSTVHVADGVPLWPS